MTTSAALSFPGAPASPAPADSTAPSLPDWEPGPPALSPAFWSLVRTRRSIRRYRPQPIPRDVLLALLAAAQWAPSAHNRQPWRFCVVTDPVVKEALCQQMGDRWRSDLAADGQDPALIARRIAVNHARLTGAPALIVPAVSMEDMDVYPDVQRNQAEWTMAVQSVALACQNLLLAAHDAGLSACWLCAPLFVADLVRLVLELPEQWHPQAIITVGYAAEARQKERAPLEQCVLWR